MGTSSSKPSKAMKSSNITENTALYIKIENDSSSNKSSKKNKNSTKVPKTSDDTSKSTKASKKAQVTSTEHDLYSIKLDVSSSSSGDAEYSNHIEHLAGPILFSAPHGLQVYRGGVISKKEESVHAKEIYTNEICLLLSLHVKKYLGIEGSFIMWNPKTAKAKVCIL